jgi:hypothetical protein
MLAICYSAAAVRQQTIVNTTQLRQPWDSTPAEQRVCGGGYSPPLSTLVFSRSCAHAFAAPNCYGVDRNASFVEGPVDCWGRRVATLDVAPRRVRRRLLPSGVAAEAGVGWEWRLREVLGFGQRRSEPGGGGCDGEVGVPEEELPSWVRETFERAAATGAGIAKI